MKKRRMLALALALALIMSLVPVSGLAAEPVGFMDPGAVMQEDSEESVNTEAVNGEEALSPDTVGDGEEGLWQDPAGSAKDNGADQALEEMPAAEDDGADQALEETPAAEDDGADQALEETPAVEDDGADQVLEETPAVEDDGADQALEETPAVEDDGADQDLEEEAAVEEENSEPVDEEDAEAVEVSAPDQNEETADAQEAVSEDTQEAAAADIQETAAADTEEAGTVDETAVPAEDGAAAESAVDEAAVPAEEESLADTSANEVEDGYSYVLMNIPYAEFYAAELAAGSPAVDAVASATKNKPRTGTLAGGSYHVDPEGTDISGVIYPVKVGKGFQLDPAKQITDESSVTITVTNRGQETTTEYTGRNALFEAPDYSWYALSAEEVPAFFKEVRSNHGNTSFGAAVGEILTAQATAEVKAKARHADYEIKLTPDEGVLDQAALAGKKITNIRYFKQNGIVDLTVDIDVPVLSTAVTLDKTSVSLLAGKTAALTATVDPEQAGQAVTWTSSDENVVTVDENGVLTAVAAGTATVTAAAADNTGASAVCEVTVTKPVSSIKLDKTSASILRGKTVTLKATVSPDDAANKAVAWSSSDKKIATVDAKGVVTGVAKGTATITAKAKDGSGVKATCKITVKQPVTKITLSKTSASILRNKTITLKATAGPSSANDQSVAWTTSNKKVATVDSKGVVKGIAKGTATITATARDGSKVKAACKITVKQPVTKITLSKTSASILRNKTITLKATAGPSSANDKSVAWTTSNKKVATVNSKGVVKGIAKGTATITATARDGSKVKAACKITVRQPVTKITLNKKSASILRNKTITLKATAGPSSANDKSVTWTTSNKKIATVNSKGVVKGIAKGTATITATAKDGSKVKAVCKITVRQPVTKLTINKTKLTVKKGKTATLKVTVAPSSANDKSLKWTTSNKNIATVTQKGVVKGIKKGTVTITAAARDGSGKKVTCKVTVN